MGISEIKVSPYRTTHKLNVKMKQREKYDKKQKKSLKTKRKKRKNKP